MVCRAGNGRLMAARELGWTKIAALIIDESSVDATAYGIMDNRSAEKGSEWDIEALAEQLQSLKEDDYDLSLTGYSEGELQEFLQELEPDFEPEEDEVPEIADDCVVSSGDLWLLGDHRLICGDCTDSEVVERLMNGEKAELCLTDPPYCVGYENQKRSLSNRTRKEMGDSYKDPSPEKVLNFIDLIPSDVLVMTFPVNKHFHLLSDKTKEWKMLYECVWVKQKFAYIMGRNYQPQHEPILIFRRKKYKKSVFNVPNNRSTVFEYNNQSINKDHPTPRPVGLWVELVKYQSNKNGLVYDPFSGSGTTLIACEQTNRKCYAIEIEPNYCQVILQRWANLTGEDPVREDGVKFSDILGISNG
jgi:DNA modification methylase